jgi:hypothetical protein
MLKTEIANEIFRRPLAEAGASNPAALALMEAFGKSMQETMEVDPQSQLAIDPDLLADFRTG